MDFDLAMMVDVLARGCILDTATVIFFPIPAALAERNPIIDNKDSRRLCGFNGRKLGDTVGGSAEFSKKM